MLRLWGEGRYIFVFILNLTFFFFPPMHLQLLSSDWGAHEKVAQKT